MEKKLRLISRIGTVAVLLAALGIGCGPSSSESENRDAGGIRNSRQVFATNYPLFAFTQTIAGETFDVVYPVPEGKSSESWTPDGDTLERMALSGAVFVNGAEFEGWLGKVSLPADVTVVTSDGFRSDWIELERGAVHSHGDGPAHSHTGVASMTWLDPTQAIQQAEAILTKLVALQPESESELQDRFDALRNSLETLDLQLEQAFASLGVDHGLASHPVYDYLARRYQVTLDSMHWEPGAAPSDEAWEALDGYLNEKSTTWMLWEGPLSAAAAAKLSDRGIRGVVFYTGVNPPENGDYFQLMEENVQRLQQP